MEKYFMMEVLSKDLKPCKNGKNRMYATCKCDCGNIKVVRYDQLRSGNTKSCGCLKLLQDRINLEKNHSHKDSDSTLYGRWLGIKGRCSNVNNKRYSNYGGRGISICDEWLTYANFKDWAIENGYAENLSIDRINVNGNYEPSNCRWVDAKVQCNNRTTNIEIVHNGIKYTMVEFCDAFALKYSTVYARYKRGDRTFEEFTRKKWSRKQYMKIPR